MNINPLAIARHASRIDELSINTIRFLSADAVQNANSGHPGAPMGAAPMAYVLWDRFLQHHPEDPKWPGRDRFVLSAGHASMLLYSLLHLTGYNLPIDQLRQFRQWDSITPGHPEHGLTPGVEATTGPLGQGVANGVGMAIAERMLGNTYNKPGHEIVDHYTYAILSDGDLEEGVAYEAASLAGTLGLGKLIYLYDDNGISIEGDTDIAFSDDIHARFRSCGWQVLGPVDGLDLDAIDHAIRQGQSCKQKPTLIIVTTTIGYGSPNKAGTGSAHGEPLGDDELDQSRQALGWDLPPFDIPDEVIAHTRSAIQRGRRLQSAWKTRFEAYSREYPIEATAFESDVNGELPEGWDKDLEELLGTFTSPVATRAVSGKAINAIANCLPRLVGGSADLAPSNNTNMSGRGDFGPENHAGRNLHFGVREHAMGSIANGMALHGGVSPYTGTFLIFSDYMRPAIRLAALSKLPVIFVFTHDSIGLGEDGPTHQPISQLMAMRLIPNLTVIRPADPDETIEAWRIAASSLSRPTALALTRQMVPSLSAVGGDRVAAGNVSKGAYILRDRTGDPEILLIGTGSEVQLALSAAMILEQEGTKVRVVSMPSWELFADQSKEYQESVLPRLVRARVSVEAGTSLGWERHIGLDGEIIGLDRFGASAPGSTLMKKLGFTAENVAEASRRVLRAN